MPEMNLRQLGVDILRRLAAVDIASCVVDEAVVAGVLEKYLTGLGFAPRPVRWAKDAQHAQDLCAQSDLTSIKEARELALARILGAAADRVDGLTWHARTEAQDAGHNRHLENAKDLIRGFDVLFSIPWCLYRERLTGDRGLRISPQGVPPWNAVEDALDYAARAYGECAWAGEGHKQQRLDFWLPFVDAYEAGLWYFWITPSEVIALSRPILRLDEGRFHAADGPGISWPGSEQQFFFLNGVRVARELVETPARDLDARLILRERNVEVRREIVRKIGIERICWDLGAQSIDSQGDYELLLLDLRDGRTRPFLKMKNPSVGVYHIEGVAPECRTVAEALAWRNQSDVPPSVLT
jgi:hypothetical protein